MVGTPWVYTPPYTLPGTPPCYTATSLSGTRAQCSLQCTAVTAWAQEGNNPWVGEVLASQDPKGVKVGIPLCVETSALRGEIL